MPDFTRPALYGFSLPAIRENGEPTNSHSTQFQSKRFFGTVLGFSSGEDDPFVDADIVDHAYPEAAGI